MLHSAHAPARGVIRDYLHAWLEVMLASIDGRTSRQHYAHVKRFLWHTKITHACQLDYRTIQSYVAYLNTQGYAPSTVHKHFFAISNLAKYLKNRRLPHARGGQRDPGPGRILRHPPQGPHGPLYRPAAGGAGAAAV